MKRIFEATMPALFSLVFIFSGFAQTLEEGDNLYKQSKYSDSINIYENILKDKPGDYGALWRLSRSYNMQADEEAKKASKKEVLQKAVEYARLAINANDKGYEGYLYLATGLGKLSDYISSRERVRSCYEIRDAALKAIELNPSDPEANLILGSWHRSIVTASWFEKNMAEMLFGGLPEASLEDAEKYLKRSIELDPKSIETHYELALVYEELGKKEAARAELEEALKCPVLYSREQEIRKKVLARRNREDR